MDFNEFACAVEEQINLNLTGGVRAGIYTAVKNNGRERTGILIEAPGVNISPTIYLEEFFENYRNGTSMDEVVEEMLKFYESIRKEESWNCEDLLTFEGVKDRVVFRLINTAANREFLEEVPHLAFLDLSVVFYVLLEVNGESTATLVVNHAHMRRWDVTVETLWKTAAENAKVLLPAEFFTMKYALREIMGKSTEYGRADQSGNLFAANVQCSDGMYVLSNKLRSYGAACMAYPHVLDMIGQILRKDFYILPSSIHEVVIVPQNPVLCCSDMNEMVKEVNETQVEDEEVLSDHVYLYERNTGRLLCGTENRAGKCCVQENVF